MDRRVDPTSVETVAVAAASASSGSHTSSSFIPDEGRFVPGTLLNGRYRIIGVLGRGGMGEVYRATDLTLGQAVALKFLPEEAAGNQRLLERFHGEVRVARQVSHPNVCRVYDIGEAEGLPFISMEYVDGEDLASLLLRIGRLPADKALDTARKLCAGLAAAHDRGVIHRDLKPHNVMMNRRGEVVIMDFGLAAIADQLVGAEARNGTPAYMSPEQLKGSEVTTKSDIYSLGLVLYELFTGRRPYDGQSIQQLLDQQEAAQLTSMTSIATDVDPAVEKAIRRCLDPDPAKRPPNALAVSAALPGGDPLAAALAAGETPSPETVAAAGKTEGLALKYSIPCLVMVVLSLIGSTFVRARTSALANSPSEYPPSVLRQKARDVVAALGYSKKPADSTIWLAYRVQLLRYLRSLAGPKWDEWLAAESPIMATYREASSPLVAWPYGDVSDENPAPIKPGMVTVSVDGEGRLRSFSAAPYEAAEPLGEAVPAEAVFKAAGLDMSNFSEIPPTSPPPHASDQMRAWKGPHPNIANIELGIAIAWWQGRITHAQVEFPWMKRTASGSERSLLRTISGYLSLIAGAVGIPLTILLARRNWKLERTDRKGALRIAGAYFLLSMVFWIGTVHPISNDTMVMLFMRSASSWLMPAALVWLLYLALEPAVRSRWPHSIVTWNRILTGRWRDAQVGSHVLIGAAIGGAIWLVFTFLQIWIDSPIGMTASGSLFPTMGTRHWVAYYASHIFNSINVGLIGFFVIFALRTLLKRDVLAASAAAVLFTMMEGNVINSANWQIKAVMFVAIFAILIFVLLRLGLLTTVSAIFFVNSIGANTLATDWKTWYAPFGIATLMLLTAVAVIAFRQSLCGRDLLGSEAT